LRNVEENTSEERGKKVLVDAKGIVMNWVPSREGSNKPSLDSTNRGNKQSDEQKNRPIIRKSKTIASATKEPKNKGKEKVRNKSTAMEKVNRERIKNTHGPKDTSTRSPGESKRSRTQRGLESMGLHQNKKGKTRNPSETEGGPMKGKENIGPKKRRKELQNYFDNRKNKEMKQILQLEAKEKRKVG